MPMPIHLSPSEDVSMETLIAGIWSESLGAGTIGIDDDILDLGGHSMVAASIVRRTADRFRCPLGVVDLIEANTVRKMAELVRNRQKQSLHRAA